jgi:predicted metal-dependent hydrolase
MEYQIIYSRRKTLAIQITRNGEVVIKAPKGASQAKILSFVAGHEGWIRSHLDAVRVHNEKYPEPSEDEYKALIERANEILPKRVEHFAKIMGVSPVSVSINRAKTRFGSCSDKGRINFSCRLMMYPEDAIDYVVVHELAHLRFLNHSKDFWGFVEAFMPDYKRRRALFK